LHCTTLTLCIAVATCSAAAAAVEAAVYLILKEVTLSGSTSILALPSSEPSVQGLALSRLHILLWRPSWWPSTWANDAAQQMVDRGVLLQLAALLKPGTDAGEQGMGVLLLYATAMRASGVLGAYNLH
jgi:hypothetical protein